MMTNLFIKFKLSTVFYSLVQAQDKQRQKGKQTATFIPNVALLAEIK